MSATEIKRELGLAASTDTIQRRIKEQGLESGAAVRKPAFTEEHCRAWLRFAQEHAGWAGEQWALVVFTDESTFSSRFHQWRRV